MFDSKSENRDRPVEAVEAVSEARAGGSGLGSQYRTSATAMAVELSFRGEELAIVRVVTRRRSSQHWGH